MVHLHHLFLVAFAAVVSATAGSNIEVIRQQGLAEVFSSCITPDTVAITFDDGPYIYQRDLVDWLNQNGVKATFFVNGDNWRCIYDDDIIDSLRYAYDSGHLIASHAWAHLNLSEQSWDTVYYEMEQLDISLERILGVTPAWMRPPWGEYNDIVRAVSEIRHQSLVLWDFDSRDWTGEVEVIKQAYADLANERPTNILALNHETHASTVYEVIPYAVEQLKAKGYNFVTVSTCLGGMSDYWNVTERGTKDYVALLKKSKQLLVDVIEI